MILISTRFTDNTLFRVFSSSETDVLRDRLLLSPLYSVREEIYRYPPATAYL